MNTILYDYLNNYSEFERFERKFKNMADFSRQIKIIPWQEDFEAAKSSYREDQTVSFWAKKEIAQEEKPDFFSLIHELGHIYFRVDDVYWNARYLGGETVLWLIYHDKIEGTEDTIRNYITFLKVMHKKPRASNILLNKIAQETAHTFQLPNIANIADYALATGIILNCHLSLSVPEQEKETLFPSFDLLEETDLWFVLGNMFAGTFYDDPFWTKFTRKFLKKLETPIPSAKRQTKFNPHLPTL